MVYIQIGNHISGTTKKGKNHRFTGICLSSAIPKFFKSTRNLSIRLCSTPQWWKQTTRVPFMEALTSYYLHQGEQDAFQARID